MIIKAPPTSWRFGRLAFSPIWIWIGLGLITLIVALSYIPRAGDDVVLEDIVFCGAEEKVLQNGSLVFQGENGIFENAASQSDEAARTGQYSSKTSAENNYGITYILPHPMPGERYRATVWRQGNKLVNSYLVVSILDTGINAYYKQVNQPVEVDDEEWERLEIVFQIPQNYQNKTVKIYVYGGETPAYFDDMEIEHLPQGRQASSLPDSSLARLHILIDDTDMLYLEKRRQEALNTGIYFARDEDWVKAKLISSEEEIPVKLRFKGDWMDHLVHNKWSFRIKVKEPHAWNRMLTFSVQRPENRDFLSEWVYHWWLDREDVLTTRYDFVELSLNDEFKGLYAYEEHFEKQLLEYRARREGPIVKFSEDGVWNARKRWLDLEQGAVEIEETLNSYEAATVLPFQEGKTLRDTALAQQFSMAQNLMQQYKFGQKSTSEIFDIERLAKFYAITDICQAFHATVWHNQRFYFNPVIGRLEPIGYDGYTEEGIYQLGKPFIGADVNQLSGDFGDDLLRQHMLDETFVARYLYYLDAYSQKFYQDNLWLDLEPLLQKKLGILHAEYPAYQYNKAIIMEQAAKVQRLMFPLNNNSVRAFQEKPGEVAVMNHHILPLEIVGFGKKKDALRDSLQTPLWLMPRPRNTVPSYHEFAEPFANDFLFFRLPGHERLYYSRILPWAPDIAEIPSQTAFNRVDVQSIDLWEVQGQQLLIRAGEYRLDYNLTVPEGFEVVFAPGVNLDMVEGSRFLSLSPVIMHGTEEEPIRIFSSDQSGRGFTLLQTDKPSQLEYVSFEHLNSLEDQSWKLTGAVTFYEAEVHINHCIFTRNHSEDALNLIRSPFSLKNSVISHTLSDGLDLDFCEGEIRNLSCFSTGNDGLDFSGSKVQMWNVQVKDPGDKGISVGEESTVTIHSATVEGARIGLASKDLSRVQVKKMVLLNCKIAFSAYQKKPEYGGASIHVQSYEAEGIKYLHMIEQGSELLINGKKVEAI